MRGAPSFLLVTVILAEGGGGRSSTPVRWFFRGAPRESYGYAPVINVRYPRGWVREISGERVGLVGEPPPPHMPPRGRPLQTKCCRVLKDRVPARMPVPAMTHETQGESGSWFPTFGPPKRPSPGQSRTLGFEHCL